jgi:multidrug efflux pump subunit AcrA (membrane-fusion protein)
MATGLTAGEREAVQTELRQVFDERAAGVLVDVLDRVVVSRERDGVVTREDFSELRQVVAELAAAQVRTEQRVEELAAAQVRTEQRVEELAAAQARTEHQLNRLTERVDRLTERMDQLSGRMEELAAAQTRTERAVQQLSKQVGGLSESIGGDIEDIAYIVLYDVLKREFGWDVGVLERAWVRWGADIEEVNVFGQAKDPAKPGRTIWIVGEAKHNLTVREVDRFARQVERARRHLAGEVFPVCFCYRARPEVQERVKDAGLRLVFSYGKLA